MTNAIRPRYPNVRFSVTYTKDSVFEFACYRQAGVNDAREPLEFGLLFHHPLNMDPRRFGFLQQPYTGSHTYVSKRVYFPRSAVGNDVSTPAPRNILRVQELGSEKRLVLSAVAPPVCVGAVLASTTSTLRVRCHVNRHPFVHGFQLGDVVHVGFCTEQSVVGVQDGEQVEIALQSTRAVLPEGKLSCVVSEVAFDDDLCVVGLDAPAIADLRDPDTCIMLSSVPDPFNMHFAKPQSLPSTMVGFPARAICCDTDGASSPTHRDLWRPCFEAPHVHDFDHPDYVCLTFSESSGATLEHSHQGENKFIFCKLSLYPLFREERMLPRDTTLSRDNMATFTLAFWNPDMKTPYCFHGAEFSFSLNFMYATPG